MARSVMSSMLPTGVGTMYNIPITAAKVRKNQIKAKELGFIYYLYTIIDGLCTIIDGKNHPFCTQSEESDFKFNSSAPSWHSEQPGR